MIPSRMKPELPAPALPTRIPALDGLRGIAILLVLLWHSLFQIGFRQHPGLNKLISLGRLSWSGVDLFFVLSGFLIGGILLDHRDSPRYFSTFYWRRAYRILPLYFVLLGACWLAQQFGNLFPGRLPWWSFFTLFQNWGMAWTGGFDRGGLGVTWSLAIEEQFYLTLPFVIRRITTKALWYLLAAVIAGAPMLRVLLIHYAAHGALAAYILTPCRADALAMGVVCALLARNEKAWSWLIAHRPVLYAAVGALGLGLGALLANGYGYYDKTLDGLEFSVLACFYAAVLLIAITRDDRFVRVVFSNPLLRKLGLIAYATYLLHFICIDFFSHLSGQQSALGFVGAPVLGIMVAIALAAISWRSLEKPLVRRGHAHEY